ncbi:MAG: hypothetical protein ACOX9B_12435 [Candidatus Xenobium sp.]
MELLDRLFQLVRGLGLGLLLEGPGEDLVLGEAVQVLPGPLDLVIDLALAPRQQDPQEQAHGGWEEEGGQATQGGLDLLDDLREIGARVQGQGIGQSPHGHDQSHDGGDDGQRDQDVRQEGGELLQRRLGPAQQEGPDVPLHEGRVDHPIEEFLAVAQGGELVIGQVLGEIPGRSGRPQGPEQGALLLAPIQGPLALHQGEPENDEEYQHREAQYGSFHSVS